MTYNDFHIAVSTKFLDLVYGPNPSDFRLTATWWLSCILRIFWGLLIIPMPLLGWFISFMSDNIDYGFAIRAKIKFKQYEYVDKTLDIWFRICCVITAYYYQWDIANLFLGLVVFRFVGDILFALTKNQVSLLLFPNIIEPLFPAYILFVAWNLPAWAIYPIFGLCVTIKIYHEYQIHYQKWIDPYSAKFLKANPGLRPEGE
jgi:hypothetical protein